MTQMPKRLPPVRHVVVTSVVAAVVIIPQLLMILLGGESIVVECPDGHTPLTHAACFR